MRPYRKERVESVVREIVSEAIAHRMNDPRVAPLTTVSRVRITGDLTIATVYLTVQGDAQAERRTMAAMQHAAGFLQRMVARQLDIRQCPELRFEVDEAVKRVRETMRLLDENRRSRPEESESDDQLAATRDDVGDGGETTDIHGIELDEGGGP